MHNADTRYNIDALLDRIPSDRSELVLGFTPWAEDCEGWTRSVRADHPETPEVTVARTVWDSPGDRDARVLIDVYECPSAQVAVESLIQVLRQDQLAVVPEGPSHIGEISFAHPDGMRPVIILTRGNLCVVVASFGKRSIPIAPWAERLDQRLLERPRDVQEVEILVGAPQSAKADEDLAFDVRMPWSLVEDGYLKFFSTGGTLERADGHIKARAEARGQLEVDAFLVEPGRPSFSQRLNVAVS